MDAAHTLEPSAFRRPDDDSDLPLACESVALQAAGGDRRALVLTPTAEVVLASPTNLRGELSEADRTILAHARRAAERHGATVCIFRGQGPGGFYRFDETLGFERAVALAEAMLEGQLLAYREMVRLGMCLFVHVEFGDIETRAFRAATDNVARSLEGRTDGHAEVDRWILQNLVFFFTVSFETLTTSVLPDKLPMLEKRMDRVRRMMAARPPAVR